MGMLPGHSCWGRADQGNGFALVTAIDEEVFAIHRDDAVLRVQLAHPDQAEVRQVGVAIGIPLRKSRELRKILQAIEGQDDQPLSDHGEDEGHALEMEGRFRQHRLARQEGVGHALSDGDGPIVMSVIAVGEGHEKARVGDPLHEREKPFRLERSFGPRTLPASRRNPCVPAPALAFSNWSRISFP
jgi:hypothetical protein